MMERMNRHNRHFKSLVLVVIFVIFWVSLQATAQGVTRPQYSITLPRAPFLAIDTDTLPAFERSICWIEKTGYCEDFENNAYMIYSVIDWGNETLGGIWMIGDEKCYIMMFYSQAEHPYIAEWLTECPYYED